MNRVAQLVILATALLLTAALGCSDLASNVLGDDAAGETRTAVSSLELADQEAGLIAVGVDLIDLSMTPEDIATAIGAGTEDRFEPAGCVDTEVLGAVVTYHFNDCDGPFGLKGVSGVAALTLAVAGSDDIAANLTTTDLSADSGYLTVNTSSTITVNPDGTRQIALATTGGGVTPDETPIARSGSYVALVDGDCITLDGTWNTTVETSVWSTAVSNYKRCNGGCPESGTLVYTAIEDDGEDISAEPNVTAVTLQFDGSDSAGYVSSSGAIGVAPLSCE